MNDPEYLTKFRPAPFSIARRIVSFPDRLSSAYIASSITRAILKAIRAGVGWSGTETTRRTAIRNQITSCQGFTHI